MASGTNFTVVERTATGHSAVANRRPVILRSPSSTGVRSSRASVCSSFPTTSPKADAQAGCAAQARPIAW